MDSGSALGQAFRGAFEHARLRLRLGRPHHCCNHCCLWAIETLFAFGGHELMKGLSPSVALARPDAAQDTAEREGLFLRL